MSLLSDIRKVETRSGEVLAMQADSYDGATYLQITGVGNPRYRVAKLSPKETLVLINALLDFYIQSVGVERGEL